MGLKLEATTLDGAQVELMPSALCLDGRGGVARQRVAEGHSMQRGLVQDFLASDSHVTGMWGVLGVGWECRVDPGMESLLSLSSQGALVSGIVLIRELLSRAPCPQGQHVLSGRFSVGQLFNLF